MTQTIRTPKGHNALWIEADYGQGRRGAPREIEWYKIRLAEFLNEIDPADLADMHEAQAESFLVDLLCFGNKGYAYRAWDNGQSTIHPTFADARNWAYGKDS